MAKTDKITVDVEAKITVSDATCECCLKLIEMWLNDNPDKRIYGGTRMANGMIEPLKIYIRTDKEMEGEDE